MLGFHALGQQALGATVATDELVLISDAGTFTLAGQAVALLVHRRLSAEVGVFTLSGNVPDTSVTFNRLRMSSGGGVRGLLASAGGGGKGLRIRA